MLLPFSSYRERKKLSLFLFEEIILKFMVCLLRFESASFTLLISLKLQSCHQLKICGFLSPVTAGCWWDRFLINYQKIQKIFQVDKVQGNRNYFHRGTHVCERAYMCLHISSHKLLLMAIKFSSIKAVVAQNAPAPGKRRWVVFGSIVAVLPRAREDGTVPTAGALAESQRHQGMFWETLEKAAQG